MCDICGKGSMMITPRKLLRGNWNPTPKTRKYPNLQTLRIQGKKIKSCTRCLRTLKREIEKEKEVQK